MFLPTYGSWLNSIEAEFAALRYFTLSGTDHRTHTEQGAAIAAYACGATPEPTANATPPPNRPSGPGPVT
ncbi:hypothetical protein GCM10023196_099510 [Actinoallomurus vinaceus]|uniref:Tc1-like transposase DDE domain-containing protein n=1 Tax=Actinoallomurus vinaceus TaxID=1080074 RepID=A0ABP8UUL0_9ACTN